MNHKQSSVGRPEPIWKDAYRRLRLAIIRREIVPASRLVEVEVSAALGISRTPLREALARLEFDGLIEGGPTGGYFVVDIASDLTDAYDLRAATECYCARLAAERATPAEIERLRENIAEARGLPLSAAHDRAELNAAFHRGIAEAAKSPKLLQSYVNVSDMMLTDEDLALHSQEARERFLVDHELILGVIAEGDAGSAESMMRRHIFRARDLILARRKGAAGRPETMQ